MKTRIIFFLMFGIWFIDYLTTFIALNFFEGFYESNLLMAVIYSWGGLGWILSPLVVFVVLLLFAQLVSIASFYCNQKSYGSGFFLAYSSIGAFFILETAIIINNIFWMTL